MKVLIDKKLKELSKSRYWLAKETGISYPTIKYLCDNATDSVRFDTIEKICQALQCDICDIISIK
ncbi:MAG: helix-turn-helix transcriptional regulator [Clostridiales bacterium]|nr:helix-turn-helix transcriptional regulator [Clostridiales bacterium]